MDALKWKKANFADSFGFVADTDTGVFRVLWSSRFHGWAYKNRIFEHVDQAKGAAQVEYERRRATK